MRTTEFGFVDKHKKEMLRELNRGPKPRGVATEEFQRR